jgi:selenophosphate synthase
LFDPQTAGGFLFVLDPTQKRILDELDKKKINYSVIGRVTNARKKIKVI